MACARSISIKWEKGKAREEEEEKRASKHRTHHALQTSSYRVDAPTALNRREGLAECTRQKRIEHRCTGGRKGIPFRGTLALEEIDSIHTRVPDAASYRGNLKFISKGWTWCAAGTSVLWHFVVQNTPIQRWEQSKSSCCIINGTTAAVGPRSASFAAAAAANDLVRRLGNGGGGGFVVARIHI